MKARLYVCVLLTALVAVFTISGCNKAPETEITATLDEVVISSTSIIETTATTTVAPTETTVGETTTKAEEVTEAIDVNQTSDKVTASNTDKTENNAPANTQKPNNTSGNANSNTTSNTEKPKPKPIETKPKETQPLVTEAPAVITDDTPLTFEQMNTEEMMQRMVDDCIEYFTSLGMTYNEELDPSWAGWYYGWQGGNEHTAIRSYNQNSNRNIMGIQNQVDGILIDYYGCKYTDITFKPCYELTDRGTYSIIFCYG